MNRLFFFSITAVYSGSLAILAETSQYRGTLILYPYFAIMLILWISIACLFRILSKIPASDESWKSRIFISALCFRLIALCGEPLFEDDFWRYLFDGWVFSSRGTPYGIAPSDFFGESSVPEAFQQILAKINYPEFPTIYGPSLEYIFLLAFYLAPAKLIGMKLILLLADLTLLVVIFRKASVKGLLIYAWCPLLLQECYFSAHADLLGAMPLFLAILYVEEHRRDILRGALSGIALAAKVTALPVLLISLPRFGWKSLFTATVSLLILYLPFFLRGGSTEFPIVTSFLSQWEFNPALYGIIKLLSGPLIARFTCAGLFGILVFSLMIQAAHRSPTPPIRGDVIIGLLLLCSPVVNPWYLLWMLPFISLYPTTWGITALAVAPLSYAHGLYLELPNLRPYELPLAISVFEYGAIAGAILWDVKRGKTA